MADWRYRSQVHSRLGLVSLKCDHLSYSAIERGVHFRSESVDDNLCASVGGFEKME